MNHILTTPPEGIKLKQDVLAVDVLYALDAFMALYSVEVHPMYDPDEEDTSVPMSNPEDRLAVVDGRLHARFACTLHPLKEVDKQFFMSSIASLTEVSESVVAQV